VLKIRIANERGFYLQSMFHDNCILPQHSFKHSQPRMSRRRLHSECTDPVENNPQERRSKSQTRKLSSKSTRFESRIREPSLQEETTFRRHVIRKMTRALSVS
jgi:hypothetical protein